MAAEYRGCFDRGYYWVGRLFLTFMLIVFVGMGIHILSISFGNPPEEPSNSNFQNGLGTSLPVAYFFILILILGVYQPPFLERLLEDAYRFLEKTPDVGSALERE